MKDDIQAIAALFSAVALTTIITLLFSGAAQWLAGVAYRLGLVSVAAQWTIYAMGLCICIGVVLTIAARVVDGQWWFK